MKYTVLFLTIFTALLIQNDKVDALLRVSMDNPKNVINVDDTSWGTLSSGILKSHFGMTYATNRNKILILSAPTGYGMMVSIRLLDLRPRSQDILTLYASNSSQPPSRFENTYFYRNKIYNSHEILTYNDPNGQVAVEFSTAPGSSYGYKGFELIFTAYSNPVCGESTFRCRNGNCISKFLRCDGHNHCGDRSDQISCSTDTRKGGKITGIVFGVVFVLIAVSCAIFIVVRRASRSITETETIISQPVTTYPPPQGQPFYGQPGVYYPPPPPTSSQGLNNPVYH